MPTCSNSLNATQEPQPAQACKIPGDFQTSLFCKAWNPSVNLAIRDGAHDKGVAWPLYRAALNSAIVTLPVYI